MIKEENDPEQTRVRKVGLIGEKASGKTNLFMDLPYALDQGLHGYPVEEELKIIPDRDTLFKVKDYRRRDPEIGTNQLQRGRYMLSRTQVPARQSWTGEPRDRDWKSIEFELMDAPGETQFPTNSGKDHFPKQREEQNEWLMDAKGLIITLPAFKLVDPEALSKILEYLMNIDSNRLLGLSRVVVTLTMFDLLMFRFRDRALEFAAIPSFVRDILHAAIDKDTLDDLRYFQTEHLDRDVEIRFIAISSWGFLPTYGCANLDPNGVKPDGTEFGQRLTDIESHHQDPTSAKRYPYMAADPVIYAATGQENPFFFRREQLTGER